MLLTPFLETENEPRVNIECSPNALYLTCDKGTNIHLVRILLEILQQIRGILSVEVHNAGDSQHPIRSASLRPWTGIRLKEALYPYTHLLGVPTRGFRGLLILQRETNTEIRLDLKTQSLGIFGKPIYVNALQRALQKRILPRLPEEEAEPADCAGHRIIPDLYNELGIAF